MQVQLTRGPLAERVCLPPPPSRCCMHVYMAVTFMVIPILFGGTDVSWKLAVVVTAGFVSLARLH